MSASDKAAAAVVLGASTPHFTEGDLRLIHDALTGDLDGLLLDGDVSLDTVEALVAKVDEVLVPSTPSHPTHRANSMPGVLCYGKHCAGESAWFDCAGGKV